MATISTALRDFKEPTKDELAQIFFSLPVSSTEKGWAGVQSGEKMEINAVLSLGDAIEDSYVRFTFLAWSIISQLTCLGWQIVHHGTVSVLLVSGQEVSAFYDTTRNDQTRGTPQRARWSIRS